MIILGGVYDAVDDYVINACHDWEQANGIAQVRMRGHVADYDVVNILLALCPIVIHNVS